MVVRKRMVRRRRFVPRRRFFRRKLSRFRRADRSLTTASGAPRSDFRRSRYVKRRVYRSRMYRSTDFKAKYGSMITQNLSVSTPASINQKHQFAQSMYLFNAAFYTLAGGGYARDLGVLPQFDPTSLYVRGGKAEVRISNPATNIQAVEIEVATIFTKPSANLAPIASGDVDRGYDFTISPLAFDCGKMMTRKVVLLKPGECSVFVHFFRPQKIYHQDYINAQRSPMWYVTLGNLNNNGAVGLNFNLSYSLSFVGDADSPTAPA